jgi:hypothetical protein
MSNYGLLHFIPGSYAGNDLFGVPPVAIAVCPAAHTCQAIKIFSNCMNEEYSNGFFLKKGLSPYFFDLFYHK